MSKKPKSIKTTDAAAPSKTEPNESASIDGVVDDVIDLPIVDDGIILTGAAADATDLDERLKDLPRILRVALLINHGNRDVHDRLVADVEALHPGLPLTAVFATTDDPATALALAKELDRYAVADDAPELRHIADCVRLLSLPMQKDLASSGDYRRVTQTLMNALGRLPDDIDVKLAAEIESFCIGWAMIPALRHRLGRYQRSGLVAANHASTLGDHTAPHRVAAAEEAMRARLEARAANQRDEDADADDQSAPQAPAPLSSASGQHHRLIVQLNKTEMKNARLKELLPQFEGIVNKALPLVAPPPLEEVRKILLFEFPHARNVIDSVLSDLIGRPTVLVRPTIIWGQPGGGKSLIARRLAECLSVSCWRTDSSRSDAAFGGTDRRWSSAEPCHPLLAIARAGHANPMVLLDELEKAGGTGGGNRIDGIGRLWDCLLGMLETETSFRYPDPFFQKNVDLSQISYLATANSVAALPRPLLDRFRVLELALPSRDHLDALLPAVLVDLARDRGLNASWIAPLDGDEYAAIASAWVGGSVRNLRRLVEVILRDRDASAIRN
ncbi:AAA family ATPase [Bradyrhizobium arachidis]|uniref:AAA family ATPase n=1 Tax=Bradyrhizobium arachidis TaxID=858423 RepID=UPI0008E5DA8C|nr:AAA family ATPase [Bradyrhizobium arachidis]SFU79473.1 ATPase family associated with various cellular activities (AAA) [Bradyrhizobium arachidis]